ncbi:MAG: alginate export family protein [Pseudomonadota bacterium]
MKSLLSSVSPGLLKQTALAAALLFSFGVQAEGVDVLRYAISGGTPSLDARLRWEQVDQSNALLTADAFTVRGRLGYTTGKWNDLDAMLEYEGVSSLLASEYNSTRNGRTRYSVVADPSGEELNQAWIRYAGLPLKTTAKFGRQRLIFDNARFIGNVGWRMNEQTYDAALLSNAFLPKTVIELAHISNANSFFTGMNIPMQGDVLRLSNTEFAWANASAYGYFLDFDTSIATRQDTKTIGLRLSGTVPVQQFKLAYTLEYATQQGFADAPAFVDAEYKLAEAQVTLPSFGPVKTPALKLGYEVLGGDGAFGFQTPLATLHAFQGWADMFLNTPATGIQDSYIATSATIEKVSAQLIWHDYRSDSGGRHYGSEWNAYFTRPLIENLIAGVKIADYNAKDFAVNTRKLWVSLDYKF